MKPTSPAGVAPGPRRHRPRLILRLAVLTLVLVWGSGCAVRTVPPLKYVPLLGTEKKISTPTVLARALRDPDVGVRAQAVKLLGILGQSKSGKVKREVAEVLGMATRDRDPGIRLLAVERLGEMEERYGNKHLMAVLRDPNPFVREKVMAVLSGRQERAAAAAVPPTTAPADSAAAP
ncbi:MAG: HEAT repeat domain-containing protein [Candidatus Latescibacterota bacterium]|jgi:hypothetical protein